MSPFSQFKIRKPQLEEKKKQKKKKKKEKMMVMDKKMLTEHEIPPKSYERAGRTK